MNRSTLFVLVTIFYVGTVVLRLAVTSDHAASSKVVTSAWLQVMSVYAPSWLKHMAADWVWLTFIQKDLASLSATDLYQIGQQVKALDPHFTAALRLLCMTLIFYKKDLNLAGCLTTEILESPINRTDWRLYSYLRIIEPRKWYSLSITQVNNSNSVCRIIKSELPVMPNYLKKTSYQEKCA